MKKYFYLFLLISETFFSLEGHAQIPDHCGTMAYLELMKQKDPTLFDRLNKNELRMQAYIRQMRSSAITFTRTVPVVVHLIWHETYQNLCDAVVQSQIDVLNEDYARLNADTINTPEPFKSLGYDTQIRFVLANRDPLGNKTTGIIRSFTDLVSFPYGNTMKSDTTGGQNQWDPNRYLNIWVCNLEGSVLGWAFLPETSINPGEDGIVVTTKAFGRYSYDPAGKYNLGRTTTHEVGHWLNLYHTWGDDDGGCIQDDKVTDTPKQSNYTFGCPAYPHKSCSNGPDGDLFMDYMDYTDDKCMNIFTKGQIDRMHFAIDSLRTSILSSNGYVPDSTSSRFKEQSESIVVAPNPFQTSFNINVKLKKVSDLQINVYDLIGNLLYQKKFANCFCKSFNVDMTGFNRGVYIARIKSNEETLVTKLFLSR